MLNLPYWPGQFPRNSYGWRRCISDYLPLEEWITYCMLGIYCRIQDVNPGILAFPLREDKIHVRNGWYARCPRYDGQIFGRKTLSNSTNAWVSFEDLVLLSSSVLVLDFCPSASVAGFALVREPRIGPRPFIWNFATNLCCRSRSLCWR